MKLLNLRSLCFLLKFQSRSILARTLGLCSKLVPGLGLNFCFMSVLNEVELLIFYSFSSGSSSILGMSSAKSLEFANTFQLFVRAYFCTYMQLSCTDNIYISVCPVLFACVTKEVITVTKLALALQECRLWVLPVLPLWTRGLQIQRLERTFVKDQNPITCYFSEQRAYTDRSVMLWL